MFLINPIIWMFKVENFKRHFLYMCLTALAFWTLASVIGILIPQIIGDVDFIVNIVLTVISAVLYIIPFLCSSGYFWCLADNTINRDQTVTANSVYNGKTEFINKITLPEWNISRFIWRGIASIIATIIMYIPFAILICLFVFNMNTILEFWHIDSTYALFVGIGIYLLFCFIIPALLWNYARRDSVFAVLNIPKATYIIGSYPGKYLQNIILFVIFYLVHNISIKLIMLLFGIATIPLAFSAHTFGSAWDVIYNLFASTSMIIVIVISYVMSVYWNYVYAYLLGTITPPTEY